MKTEVKKIDDLLPDPNNVNRHTQRGHGLVENSIRRRGVGRGILAAGLNTEKPVIMAGNLTHEKARDAGIDEVVFVHTTGNQLVVTVRDDLDPTSPEAIALGIEDNEAGKLSYNPDIDLLAAMSAGDNGVLSKLKEDDKIFGDMLAGMGVKESEPVDAEPQIDRAAELAEKWQTASGQLWKLGEHRLLIGDCTVRENVERLMGGERVSLYFSDPPYNIGFAAQRNKETYTNTSDSLSEEDYLSLIQGAFIEAMKYTDNAIITSGKQNLKLWINNFEVSEIGLWIAKNKMSGGKVSHLSLWEPVLFFGKFDRASRSNDLFEFSTKFQPEADDHPCPKVIELWEDIIKHYAPESIYDSFAGSGTCFIAAHNLNRRCYAMEISEKYGAVILERFFTATGIQPELVTE